MEAIILEVIPVAFVLMMVGAVFTAIYVGSGQRKRDRRRISTLKCCYECGSASLKMSTGICGVPHKKCMNCGTKVRPGDIKQ